MLTRAYKQLMRIPIAGKLFSAAFRFAIGFRQAARPLGLFVSWLVRSNEYTNFTYELTERNKRHLAAFIADVTSARYETALGFIRELEADENLQAAVKRATMRHEEGRFADSEVRYGRRLGWYALVRILKPRVVVETGVDKGLGSVVLTAALRRNGLEGHPGVYYGTDINTKAGYMLHGEYAQYGRILYGDSIESLSRLDCEIDLFINDSDHSPVYERREYDVVRGKLSDRAVIVGDNAHATDSLLQFALETGRRFAFFRETPRNHWYQGAGIGVAFKD